MVQNSNEWFLVTNIKNYMNKNNINVYEFCKESKLHIFTIKRFLRGEKFSARLDTCEKLANILKVTMDQLLFEEIQFD